MHPRAHPEYRDRRRAVGPTSAVNYAAFRLPLLHANRAGRRGDTGTHPTNILRARNRPAAKPAANRARRGERREVLIRAGAVSLRATLLPTPTADRIWAALPLHSTAEVWGEEVFFETPVESGRERGAKAIVRPGEIAFAPDRDVVAIAYGRTPLSKKGETRLWSPSNIWAETRDDVRQLAAVRPGAKVEVIALERRANDDGAS